MQKRRLGISLYPERSTFEQDVAYMENPDPEFEDWILNGYKFQPSWALTCCSSLCWAQVTASRPSTATSPCWPRPRSWVLRSKPM